MATYKKIPADVKAKGCICTGHFAVFCKGLLKASAVAAKLYKADKKRGGIPVVGYITHNKERVYYCRYGFVDDPDIYA